MMACKECKHPVTEGYNCPFCSSKEQIEVCITCRSEVILPPGAEYPFCQNCSFEKGMAKV